MPVLTMRRMVSARSLPAFELDGVHAGFLEETPGVFDGLAGGDLVGHKRHVTDQQGVFGAAGDSFTVVEHIVHGDGQGAFITQHDHAEGITHQDHVHAHLVHDQGGGIVVGGEHADGLVARFHRLDEASGDFLTFLCRIWGY